MSRRHWHDLPPTVRAAVEQQTGRIVSTVPVATGAVSELVEVLHTADQRHFCKAITTDNPLVWMHRNEARLNPHVPSAPRLRCQVELDGWLLLIFAYAEGRHPRLDVGSPDLPAVAAALTAMSATPCPDVRVQPASARWAGLIAGELVDGNAVAHTDMTPRNFLVSDADIAVVDWSMPCRGAAWIDTALMIVRLIRAGHSAQQAEGWARNVPAFRQARPQALNAFALATAELTRRRSRQSPLPHLVELADAAALWAQHRTSSDVVNARL